MKAEQIGCDRRVGARLTTVRAAVVTLMLTAIVVAHLSLPSAQACVPVTGPVLLDCNPTIRYDDYPRGTLGSDDDIEINFSVFPKIATNVPCPPNAICPPCGPGTGFFTSYVVRDVNGVEITSGLVTLSIPPDKTTTKGSFSIPAVAGGWPIGVYTVETTCTLTLASGGGISDSSSSLAVVVPTYIDRDGTSVPIFSIENITPPGDEIVSSGERQTNWYRYVNGLPYPAVVEFRAENFNTAGVNTGGAAPGSFPTSVSWPLAGIEMVDLKLGGSGNTTVVLPGTGDINGDSITGGDSFNLQVGDPSDFQGLDSCIGPPSTLPQFTGPQGSSREFILGPNPCPNNTLEIPVHSTGFPLCAEGSACAQYAFGDVKYDVNGDGVFGGPGDDIAVCDSCPAGEQLITGTGTGDTRFDWAVGGVTENDPTLGPTLPGLGSCPKFGGQVNWNPIPGPGFLPAIQGQAFPDIPSRSYDMIVDSQPTLVEIDGFGNSNPLLPSEAFLMQDGLACYFVYKFQLPNVDPMFPPSQAFFVENFLDLNFFDVQTSQPIIADGVTNTPTGMLPNGAGLQLEGRGPYAEPKFDLAEPGGQQSTVEHLIVISAGTSVAFSLDEEIPRQPVQIFNPIIDGFLEPSNPFAPQAIFMSGELNLADIQRGEFFQTCIYITVCVRTDIRNVPATAGFGTPPMIETFNAVQPFVRSGEDLDLRGIVSDVDGDLVSAEFLSQNAGSLGSKALSGGIAPLDMTVPGTVTATITPGPNLIACVVEDAAGNADESTILVCVGAPLVGDFNGDGCVDFLDIPEFVQALQNAIKGASLDPRADINGDGRADFDDIDPFVDLVSDSAGEGCSGSGDESPG